MDEHSSTMIHPQPTEVHTPENEGELLQ